MIGTSIKPGFHARTWSAIPLVPAAIVLMTGMFAGAVETPGFAPSKHDNKVIVKSGEASRVSEIVRAAAAGVIVELSVRVGDEVKKGQVLGHTELAPTKYQLDLARHALEDRTALDAAKGHADAWAATRAETEDALRRRRVERPRLDWANGMEQFHRGNYDAQLEKKKVQRIQYEYWREQYDNRFFRAPADGVVTGILHDVGKSVQVATHVFTISNSKTYLVPLSVPAALADGVTTGSSLLVRATNGRHVSRGMVDAIAEDPQAPGSKIITLLVNEKDFPSSTGNQMQGTRFDVLLSQMEPDVGASPNSSL